MGEGLLDMAPVRCFAKPSLAPSWPHRWLRLRQSASLLINVFKRGSLFGKSLCFGTSLVFLERGWREDLTGEEKVCLQPTEKPGWSTDRS